jgi:hypothetical protein
MPESAATPYRFTLVMQRTVDGKRFRVISRRPCDKFTPVRLIRLHAPRSRAQAAFFDGGHEGSRTTPSSGRRRDHGPHRCASKRETTVTSEYVPQRSHSLLIAVMFTGFNLGSGCVGFAAPRSRPVPSPSRPNPRRPRVADARAGAARHQGRGRPLHRAEPGRFLRRQSFLAEARNGRQEIREILPALGTP